MEFVFSNQSESGASKISGCQGDLSTNCGRSPKVESVSIPDSDDRIGEPVSEILARTPGEVFSRWGDGRAINLPEFLIPASEPSGSCQEGLEMLFYTPNHDEHFDIPDHWWSFCDMSSFIPGNKHYCYDRGYPDVKVVSIKIIKPPLRVSRRSEFDKRRMVPVLLTIGSPELTLPPIEVARKLSSKTYALELLHGVHRFYGSIAAGYSHIPVVINPRRVYGAE
jgi:hypothetical protein